MEHAHRHRLARCGLISLVLSTVLVTQLPATADARPKIRDRAALAARFIVTGQEPDGSFPALSSDATSWTADAVVALAAAGRASKAAARGLDFLEANSGDVDSAGTRAKVILARLAGGRDPRSFVGRDLVEEIESEQQPDGRYGAGTSVFSHAIAMLALSGAQATGTLDAAARWLADAQCGNGGWQVTGPPTVIEDDHCSFGYPDIDEANTDTTALAIQALRVAPTHITPAHDPFAFMDTLRDHENGGWTYDRPESVHANFTSKYGNSNSNGMVLQAYSAVGIAPPEGSRHALIRLQDPLCGQEAGSFSYTWGDEDGDHAYEHSGPHNLAATIAALPGLLAAPLPQRAPTSWRPPPQPKECETKGGTGPR